MGEGLSALLVGWSIQAVGSFSPGPAVGVILGVATTRGRAAALAMSAGIACSAGVLASLVVLGLGTVIGGLDWLADALRVVGAAYLGWLALGAFRRAVDPPRVEPAATPGQEVTPGRHGPHPVRMVLGGFTLNMTNPKALVFWLAIASVGGLAELGGATLGVYVLGAMAISFTGHAAWSIVLSSAPVRTAYAAARRWIEAALGTFLALTALRIATERV